MADNQPYVEGHHYGVRSIVIGQGYGEMRYRPWCECGWIGVDTADEADAAKPAFAHATLRWPDKPAKAKRHTGPLQDDALFDPKGFER